jgi:hypothetical protein
MVVGLGNASRVGTTAVTVPDLNRVNTDGTVRALAHFTLSPRLILFDGASAMAVSTCLTLETRYVFSDPWPADRLGWQTWHQFNTSMAINSTATTGAHTGVGTGRSTVDGLPGSGSADSRDIVSGGLDLLDVDDIVSDLLFMLWISWFSELSSQTICAARMTTTTIAATTTETATVTVSVAARGGTISVGSDTALGAATSSTATPSGSGGVSGS